MEVEMASGMENKKLASTRKGIRSIMEEKKIFFSRSARNRMLREDYLIQSVPRDWRNCKENGIYDLVEVK
jgi:hypothetical protein